MLTRQSNCIEILFDLCTTGTFDPACESAKEGRVRFWATQSMTRQCTTVSLSSATQQCRLVAYMAPSVTAERVAQEVSRSKLNLEAFVQFRTASDLWCDKSAGEASVWMAELLGAGSSVHRCPGYVMGTLSSTYRAKTLFCVSNFRVVFNGQPLQFDSLPLVADLKRAEDEREKVLRAYVYTCHHIFEEMESTYPFAERINAYIINYHQRTLPTISYMFHTASSLVVAPGYFENLVATALRAEWVNRRALLQLPIGHPTLCNLFAWACLIYTNHVIYTSDETRLARRTGNMSRALLSALHIRGGGDEDGGDEDYADDPSDCEPDHLERVSMEQMGLAEHTHGAEDCEGSGGKAGREARALIHYGPRSSDQLVQMLAGTGRLYVLWDVLCSVTTGDIGGTVAALSSAKDLGAHIFTFAQPLCHAVEAIQRCAAPGLNVFADAPDIFARMVEASRRAIPLFLEGTGVSMPGPTNLPLHNRLWLPPNREPEACRARACDWGLGGAVPVRWSKMEHKKDGRNTAPLVMTDNSGCRVFASNGSLNPGGTNNGLWLAFLLTHMYPAGFAGAHRMYTWRAGESHFYRTFEIGMTTSFLELGFSLTKVAFCQRNAKSGKWTKGVDMATLFSDRMGMWRQPAMHADEISAVRREMADEQPLVPLDTPPARIWEGKLSWDPTWQPPSREEIEGRNEALGAVQISAARSLARSLPSVLACYAQRGIFKKWNMIGTLFACRDSRRCECGARAALEKMLGENAGEWALLFSLDANAVTGAEILQRLEEVLAERQDEFYGAPLTALLKFNTQQSLQPNRRHGMIDAVSVPLGLKWSDTEKVLLLYGPPHYSHEHATPDCGGVAMWTPVLLAY